MNTSDLYKEHNINIDSQWLQLFNNINTTESNKQELRNKIKSDSIYKIHLLMKTLILKKRQMLHVLTHY